MSIGSSMIFFMKLTTITITIIPIKAAIRPTTPITNNISSGIRFTTDLIEFSVCVGIEELLLELLLEYALLLVDPKLTMLELLLLDVLLENVVLAKMLVLDDSLLLLS